MNSDTIGVLHVTDLIHVTDAELRKNVTKICRFKARRKLRYNLHPLRQGWVLFKPTCVFSGIQCTKHFIEFVFVETNEVVCTNLNVILTRQTCSHHSSRVAGSKRRALAFYFPIRIWFVFSISKCRGESDLGLCMSSVLAQRMRLRNADFRFKNVFGRKIHRKLALRSGIPFSSFELMHRPRSDSPSHFDIQNTCHIRPGK